MKIAMIVDFFDINLQYQENLLVKYYIKHGHQVVVITSVFESVFDYYSDRKKINNSNSIIKEKNLTIYKNRYIINLYNKIKVISNVFQILSQEMPDIVFVHDIMPNLIDAILYIKRHKTKILIMDYHSDYSNSGKNLISIYILHKIVRKFFFYYPAKKYIKKIFPVTPQSARFLHEIYGVRYSKMQLLPLGGDIDYATEVKDTCKGVEIRKKLGIYDSDFVIFTGGKLNKLKKTELLISAFLEIDDPNFHLFIVGDSDVSDRDYKNYLIKISSKNRNIHFLGWLHPKKVYEYLDASNIAVFPSSQSILWQQAICMGLPLIVGDSGGQSIDYLNEYNSIISLSKNNLSVKSIKDNIIIIYKDISLYKSMSDGATRISRKALNYNKLILETINFIE